MGAYSAVTGCVHDSPGWAKEYREVCDVLYPFFVFELVLRVACEQRIGCCNPYDCASESFTR